MYIIVLLALLFGCSGDYSTEETGQAEQELITSTYSTQQGQCWRVTGVMYDWINDYLTYNARACMTSDNTVFVPLTKDVTLRPTNLSCSGSEFRYMLSVLDDVIGELNVSLAASGNPQTGGWTFSRSTNGQHAVQCVKVNTPLDDDSIRNFVRVVPQFKDWVIYDSDSVLNGAAYATWDSLTVQVDVRDARAYGRNATEDYNTTWHAIANGLIKFTGTGEYAGARATASGNKVSRSTYPPRQLFSPGEWCRARNYSTTQPHNMFWRTTGNCSDD